MKFFASKSAPKGKSKKSAPPPPQPVLPSFSLDTWLDILGAALLAIAALTVFGLLSSTRSPAISSWLDVINRLFGWGAYLAPIVLALVGAYLLIRRFGDRFPRLKASRLGGAVLAYVAALATLHGIGLLTTQKPGTELAAASQGGGEIGWAVLNLFIGVLGNVGAVFVLALLWGAAFLLMAHVTMTQLVKMIQASKANAQARAAHMPQRVLGAPGTPNKPTDDIIEPRSDRNRNSPSGSPLGGTSRGEAGGSGEQDYPDESELIINGLRPRKTTSRKRPNDDEQATSPRGIGVPVAPPRPAALQRPAEPSQPNRMPAPRIIGAGGATPSFQPRPIGQTSQSAAQPITQPVPPPVPQISSRLDIQREWVLPKIEDVLEPGSDASLKEGDIRQRANVI